MQTLRIYRYVDAIARTGSMRKASELMAISPSALNRQIIALEEELGEPVFERLGRGVRLTTAGELIVHHFRRHLADTEALKSRIADLSGLRRGHVNVACGQAALPFFMPEQITSYQADFPNVTFRVVNLDGRAAAQALQTYEVDVAVTFEALPPSDFQVIGSIPQEIFAFMPVDHPLARVDRVKLSDCLEYPLALPTDSYSVSVALRQIANRSSYSLHPVVEAESYVLLQNFARMRGAIAFELQIGLPGGFDTGLVAKPLHLPGGAGVVLNVVQRRGRALPVAAARFAQQMVDTLERIHTSPNAPDDIP